MARTTQADRKRAAVKAEAQARIDTLKAERTTTMRFPVGSSTVERFNDNGHEAFIVKLPDGRTTKTRKQPVIAEPTTTSSESTTTALKRDIALAEATSAAIKLGSAQQRRDQAIVTARVHGASLRDIARAVSMSAAGVSKVLLRAGIDAE